MKILLVSPNRTSLIMTCFPLGPAYLAASLKKDGHEVEIYDFLEEESPKTVLLEKINCFSPDLIGISVRNIDNQNPVNTQTFLPKIRAVVRACRDVSKAPIIIGGPGYSIFPYASLRYLEGDYGVPGEGEHTICLIAKNLERGLPVSDLPGVIKPGNNPAHHSPERIDFEEVPPPARELFQLEKYIKKNPMPIQGKRGCFMKCIYCSSPLIEGRAVRFRSPGVIAWELEMAQKRHGINNFLFVDSIFNYPEDHAVALCKEIVRKKLVIGWSGTLNPFQVTEKLVRWMKKAGCTEVSLGFESGSDRMLKILQKGFSTEDIRKSVKLLRKYEINPYGFLLFGGPGENCRSVEESFSFAEDLQLEDMRISAGIRIYPGTDLAKISLGEGLVSQDDFLTPLFYISDGVKDWIYEKVMEKKKSHPGWIL